MATLLWHTGLNFHGFAALVVASLGAIIASGLFIRFLGRILGLSRAAPSSGGGDERILALSKTFNKAVRAGHRTAIALVFAGISIHAGSMLYFGGGAH